MFIFFFKAEESRKPSFFTSHFDQLAYTMVNWQEGNMAMERKYVSFKGLNFWLLGRVGAIYGWGQGIGTFTNRSVTAIN